MSRLTGGKLLLILASVSLYSGCGSSSTVVTGPNPVKCTVTVQNNGGQMPPAGGTGTIAIGTERECTWSASADASWIVLAAKSGQGQAVVGYTVSANPDPAIRRASIVVNDERAEITQAAAACRYSVDRSTEHVGADGATIAATVTTDSSCAWTASSSVAWIGIASGAAGSGAGRVQLIVSVNTGAERTGTVTVAGREITIRQEARAPTSPPPPPSPGPAPPPPAPPSAPCTFAISPTSGSFAWEAAEATVTVQAGIGCTWTASSAVSWIRILSGASGSGSGIVALAVGENGGGARTGTVSIAGSTYTATQAAQPKPVTVKGQVSDLTGGCPALLFSVNGTVVVTSAATDFRKGACKDVKNDRKVQVTGLQRADGMLVATVVELQ